MDKVTERRVITSISEGSVVVDPAGRDTRLILVSDTAILSRMLTDKQRQELIIALGGQP